MTAAVDPNGGSTGYVRDRSTTGPMLAITYPIAGESTAVYTDKNREIHKLGSKVIGHVNTKFLVGDIDGPEGPLPSMPVTVTSPPLEVTPAPGAWIQIPKLLAPELRPPLPCTVTVPLPPAETTP